MNESNSKKQTRIRIFLKSFIANRTISAFFLKQEHLCIMHNAFQNDTLLKAWYRFVTFKVEIKRIMHFNFIFLKISAPSSQIYRIYKKGFNPLHYETHVISSIHLLPCNSLTAFCYLLERKEMWIYIYICFYKPMCGNVRTKKLRI